jgi:hypothetical protein
MPLSVFLTLILGVIAAAGVTVALVTVAGLPLAAVGLAALAGTLALGLGRRR